MTRYLVTGGAGLVGSHIVDLLVADADAEVIVLDNFSRGRHSNIRDAVSTGRVELVEGDIRDGILVRRLMQNVDILFHQAAIRITQCAEDPRMALEVMATGSFEVFDAAVNARVKKVIAASSASVYGMAESFPTGEKHHPYTNDTIYGAAKLFNEGMLKSFGATNGLNWVALRYFNVYGPRMDIHGVYTEVLMRWIQRISAELPLVIHGDGSQTVDLIHVSDVARANVLAAGSDAFGVYNIGTGVETSLLELARELLDVTGSNLHVEFEASRMVNDVMRRVADTSAARSDFAFEARIGLRDGLRDLVKWCRDDIARAVA